jgi:hypothetical protein
MQDACVAEKRGVWCGWYGMGAARCGARGRLPKGCVDGAPNAGCLHHLAFEQDGRTGGKSMQEHPSTFGHPGKAE